MKKLNLILVALALTGGLAACERETTVVQPVPVAGPPGEKGAPGEQGPQGEQGQKGRPGDTAVVIIPEKK